MSGVTGVSGGTGTLSLVDLLAEAQNESSSILDSSSTLASSERMLESARSKRAQSAYGGGASSAVGQAALQKALSEIGAGGKVTFQDIALHRDKLETEFSAQVRVDLAALGVDIETEFTLTLNAKGQIEVDCDDALAKEKIQAYLADNPEVCEQFGYIQALANLERARQSPAASAAVWQQVRDAKAEIQTQALEAFFSDATESGMGFSSLMASFSATSGTEEAASFYAGLNFTV